MRFIIRKCKYRGNSYYVLGGYVNCISYGHYHYHMKIHSIMNNKVPDICKQEVYPVTWAEHRRVFLVCPTTFNSYIIIMHADVYCRSESAMRKLNLHKY